MSVGFLYEEKSVPVAFLNRVRILSKALPSFASGMGASCGGSGRARR